MNASPISAIGAIVLLMGSETTNLVTGKRWREDQQYGEWLRADPVLLGKKSVLSQVVLAINCRGGEKTNQVTARRNQL